MSLTNGKDVDSVIMTVGSLETMYSMAQKLQWNFKPN
jgi:hypothetical protein